MLPGAVTKQEFEELSAAGSVSNGAVLARGGAGWGGSRGMGQRERAPSHPLPATDARCVVYCTVGYRSGRYAEGLRRRGVDAYNLAGGILAWTHHGGALEKPGGGESTRAVHVFARKWDLAAHAYESTYFM